MLKTSIKRPYFAHAVNAYDTPLEHAVSALIAEYFSIPVRDVENPNQPHHQRGYTAYAANRADLASTVHGGMNYFYDMVLPGCDACVAWPFLDGKMGLGVAGEAEWFLTRGKSVFLVSHVFEPVYEELRRFERDYQSGLFIVRPLLEEERDMVLAKNPRLVLSHIETRLRTWFCYQVKFRPYEIAHEAELPLPIGFYPEKAKT